MPKNLVFVTKTMSLACPEEKLQIWPSWKAWFFRNIFWPPQKNHEIGKKSKNGVHFISSVFKVVRVKVLSVLLFFAYFILFWGGQNVLIFFSQSFLKTRQKSHEIGKNYQNNSTFTLTTFKTVIIKCTPFFDFLLISCKFDAFFKAHFLLISRFSKVVLYCLHQKFRRFLVWFIKNIY